MNYFKLYENQRKKPLKIGSKWERKPDVVEIIDIIDDESVRYRYTLDGFRYLRTKKSFLDQFKPYIELTTPHELL